MFFSLALSSLRFFVRFFYFSTASFLARHALEAAWLRRDFSPFCSRDQSAKWTVCGIFGEAPAILSRRSLPLSFVFSFFSKCRSCVRVCVWRGRLGLDCLRISPGIFRICFCLCLKGDYLMAIAHCLVKDVITFVGLFF